MSETLILAGARTPFAAWSHGVTGRGTPGGAFKELDPFDLGAAALKGALARAALAPASLGHVGNPQHPQAQKAIESAAQRLHEGDDAVGLLFRHDDERELVAG